MVEQNRPAGITLNPRLLSSSPLLSVTPNEDLSEKRRIGGEGLKMM
jgi:hypothetical protein